MLKNILLVVTGVLLTINLSFAATATPTASTIFKNYSVVDFTSATVKANDLMTKGPWVDVRIFKDATHPFGNLSTAKVSPQTAGKKILIPAAVTVNTLTIPPDRAVELIKGGSINVASGKILTINGPFDAGLFQIFTGGGNVAGLGKVEAVWFGTNTAAIQAAFTAVSDGGKLHFTPGTYTYSPTTGFQVQGKSFDVEMDNGAVIDATGAASNITNPALIDISGTAGTYYLLGANITAGAKTCTVNSALAATLGQGDLLWISTRPSTGGNGSLWDSSRDYYYKGEMQEVLSVSGTTVTIKNNFLDSYTAASTGTGKITPFRGRIDNFKMKGANNHNQTGLAVRSSKGLRVTGGDITGFDNAGLLVAYAYDFIIDGARGSFHNAASQGMNYALEIDSSQIGKVINASLIGGRHGLTLGGNEPCRLISIDGNTIGSESVGLGALDTHQNTQYITMSNNHLLGGASIGGIDTDFHDNSVYYGDIHYYPGVRSASFVKFRNNIALGGNLNIDNQLGPKTIDYLYIYDNYVSGSIYIVSNNYASRALTTNIADIIGNRSDAGSNNTALSIVGYGLADQIVFGTLNFQNNTLSNGSVAPLYLSNVNVTGDILFSHNTLIGSGSYGYDFVGVTAAKFIEDHDKVTGDFTSRALYIHDNINIPYMVFDSNEYKRVTPGTQYAEVLGGAFIRFTNNFVENITYNQGVKLTATDIFYSGNKNIGTSGTLSLNGRYYESLLGNDNVQAWGTAAPATGTWKTGDRCRNSSPAVGQPKGWACTVGGGSGTWVSEGNL